MDTAISSKVLNTQLPADRPTRGRVLEVCDRLSADGKSDRFRDLPEVLDRR